MERGGGKRRYTLKGSLGSEVSVILKETFPPPAPAPAPTPVLLAMAINYRRAFVSRRREESRIGVDVDWGNKIKPGYNRAHAPGVVRFYLFYPCTLVRGVGLRVVQTDGLINIELNF
jgi:hypothetical protein